MNILQSVWCCPDFALSLIRVGIGIIFVRHGFAKVMAGTGQWTWLGQQLQVVGITFLPVVWGFIAAVTEFLGGMVFAAGFATRFVASLLAFVMLVAFLFHYNKGDAWSVYSHPLSLLIIFIAFMIGGAGKYSIDAFLSR